MSTETTARVPAEAGSRRPDPALRGTLRLLAVLVAVLLVGFSAWSLVSLLARSTERAQATYSGIRIVDVDVDFESLHVTAHDSPEVDLSRRWSWSFGEPAVSQRKVGKRLVVTSSGCGFTPGLGCTGSVDLEVPRDVTLRLRASNSGLTLQDLTGDIDASTSNGSVVGAGLSGPLRLRTSNGRVEMTGLRSTRVDGSTSNGSVRMTFLDPPTTVVARTSNGSVEVLVPRDRTTYRVDATTSNGANEVTVPTDQRSDRTIDAHTSNGAVRVLDRP